MVLSGLGRLVSGIFSRWTLLAVITAVIAWNVHLRIDQLGVPTLQGTTISAATTGSPVNVR